MSKTGILQIDEVAPTQTGKSITVNNALVALERAANRGFENLSVGASDYTVSETNFLRNHVFTFGGVTGNRSILFPDEVGSPAVDAERVFAVRNVDSDSTLTIRGVGSGTTVTLPPNSIIFCYKSGVDIIAISTNTAVSSALPYDIGFFVAGTPTASAVVARILVVRDCSFPINFAGSVGRVGTNPGSTDTYTVTNNGSSIGTMAISAAGAFTFTIASAQSLVSGDYIEFVAPGGGGPTHIDLSVTVRGTRTGA